MSLPVKPGWEGAASRMIRKSENLPEVLHVIPPRTEVYVI